ncbi:MAG TPA: EamA family transporter [Terriglobales bacterium]|nr:EamA family transporter [Terriglobales bacterium]
MILEAILFALIIVVGTGGELCVGRAMQETGQLERFRPGAAVSLLGRALRSKWIWIGVAMMTIAFFSLLLLLSFESVSFVVPVTALSYLVGAVGGIFFLGEKVAWQRWVGIGLVCLGVTIVVATK